MLILSKKVVDSHLEPIVTENETTVSSRVPNVSCPPILTVIVALNEVYIASLAYFELLVETENVLVLSSKVRIPSSLAVPVRTYYLAEQSSIDGSILCNHSDTT